jgi:hypothetical protein
MGCVTREKGRLRVRFRISETHAAIGLALVLACGTTAYAQKRVPRPPVGGQPQHHAGDWLRKYKNVPPDQQQRALENDPQFRRLSPERQQLLRQRLQRFNSLPPERQQQTLNRMETWEHLTPEQKERGRQLAMQWRNLPPGRRLMMRSAIRELRGLPTEQREQLIESERYRNQFTPQERSLLKGASQLPLAPADGSPNERAPYE